MMTVSTHHSSGSTVQKLVIWQKKKNRASKVHPFITEMCWQVKNMPNAQFLLFSSQSFDGVVAVKTITNPDTELSYPVCDITNV